MAPFREIVGHEQPLRVLQGALAARRVHHSLLFFGPDAIGKRRVATALAAALNCAAPREADACGECASCRRIDKGSHPDVTLVTLEKTMIPIDYIRRVRQEASYLPYEGQRRVFIVDPADRMSIDAQNALLKTLEEPPASSMLILVTSRPMHLLPTTRSRCQQIAFGILPAETIAPHLARLRGLTAQDALRAARLSGGRFGAAMELDLEAHDESLAALLGALGHLVKSRAREAALDDVAAFGDDTAEIASSLAMLDGIVRDMLVLETGGDASLLIHADRADQLRTLAAALAPEGAGGEALLAMANRIETAREDLERNVNRKLLLETLLFDLHAPGASAPSARS